MRPFADQTGFFLMDTRRRPEHAAAMTTAKKLAWGILSTGRIAREFALGLRQSERSRLAAVGSRARTGAEAFAAEFGCDRAHGSYDDLLADPDVEAVYIATPHPWHKEWAVAAARAGKHVLCEKPLAMDAAGAEAIVEAAREAGVFLMEAFMYRCHPQTRKVVELVRGGAVGDVRMVQASFGFKAVRDPAGRLFDPALGGGAILDIGCYPVSFSRLIAGAAAGRPFLDPVEVDGRGRVGDTGVDEAAVGQLVFGSGLLAQVSCSIDARQDNHARVYGTEGALELAWPWLPAKHSGRSEIVIHRFEQEPEVIPVEAGYIYGIEADTVASAVAAGRTEAEPPAMGWDDTLGNMRALDRWLAAVHG